MNICCVLQLLEGDRHLRIIEIANEVGLSYGSTFSIIADKLGFRKVCAEWVLHILTLEQKLNCL